MIKTFLALFIISLISVKVMSQTEEDVFNVRNISLEILASKRIPHNKISIDIKYLKKVYSIKLKSIPKSDEKMWANSKIDTSFFLNEEGFERIKSSLQKINPNDFLRDKEYNFLDGYKAVLRYGGFGAEIFYSFRSPNSRTDTRGLNAYMNTCALIMKTAGFTNGKIKKFLKLDVLPEDCE